MTENPTTEDIEEMAKLANESLGFSAKCENCGYPMHLELFWFDGFGRPYRMCPNCNTRQRKKEFEE